MSSGEDYRAMVDKVNRMTDDGRLPGEPKRPPRVYPSDAHRAGVLEGLRIAAEIVDSERNRLEEEDTCMHATFGTEAEHAEAIETLRNIASAIEARGKEMGLAKG